MSTTYLPGDRCFIAAGPDADRSKQYINTWVDSDLQFPLWEPNLVNYHVQTCCHGDLGHLEHLQWSRRLFDENANRFTPNNATLPSVTLQVCVWSCYWWDWGWFELYLSIWTEFNGPERDIMTLGSDRDYHFLHLQSPSICYWFRFLLVNWLGWFAIHTLVAELL